MKTVAVMVLLTAGTLFLLLASVGILRMPDFYMRVSATAKATTLGIECILLGTALYFGALDVTGRIFAVIAFVMLTAPVAAHLLGRAGYFSGVPLWEGTVKDELCGRSDIEGEAPSECEPKKGTSD